MTSGSCPLSSLPSPSTQERVKVGRGQAPDVSGLLWGLWTGGGQLWASPRGFPNCQGNRSQVVAMAMREGKRLFWGPQPISLNIYSEVPTARHSSRIPQTPRSPPPKRVPSVSYCYFLILITISRFCDSFHNPKSIKHRPITRHISANAAVQFNSQQLSKLHRHPSSIP